MPGFGETVGQVLGGTHLKMAMSRLSSRMLANSRYTHISMMESHSGNAGVELAFRTGHFCFSGSVAVTVHLLMSKSTSVPHR